MRCSHNSAWIMQAVGVRIRQLPAFLCYNECDMEIKHAKH